MRIDETRQNNKLERVLHVPGSLQLGVERMILRNRAEDLLLVLPRPRLLWYLESTRILPQ